MITRIVTTHALRTALLLGSLGALTMAANAQSPVAKANVPFEFAAGGAMLPSGEYSIDLSKVSGVLILQGTAKSSVALIATSAEALPPTSSVKLLFQKRDGMAYLAGVELPGENVRVSAPFQHVTKGAATASLR